MIPAMDLAKLFALRGHKATLITTKFNVPYLSQTFHRNKEMGVEIGLLLFKFPSAEVGLPEGCENFNLFSTPEMHMKFFRATTFMEKPLEELLKEHRPDCLVADTFFPWAVDVAGRYGIPRLIFDGRGYFSLCASMCLEKYEPHKKVSSDSEFFSIPYFPHEINLSRNQIPDFLKREDDSEFGKLVKAAKESESRSLGFVINSFYELESDYADYCKKVLGRKAWHIGPLSLFNNGAEAKAEDEDKSSSGEHECLKWLDSKRPNSVVYLCFGTVSAFTDDQLKEIAMSLEASGQHFIWVVKKEKKEEGDEEWLPHGFEKRMEGNGLIVRGWAPQLLILNHSAIGGFVTHCGWNSILEGVAAGLPMVTWPVFNEQFYNEKLVTQVLKIGVGVGVQKWVTLMGDTVKKEAIEKAMKQIMVGEEAEEMRKSVSVLAQKARIAVAEGGSSYNELSSLIEELKIFNC
ncbi:Glycosyltransferase [Quillaja saponaria]|nr:Glycosyltransferase [Quillaja saponaria]